MEALKRIINKKIYIQTAINMQIGSDPKSTAKTLFAGIFFNKLICNRDFFCQKYFLKNGVFRDPARAIPKFAEVIVKGSYKACAKTAYFLPLLRILRKKKKSA